MPQSLPVMWCMWTVWAHARRKFSEAVKAQGKNKHTSKTNGLEPYAYLRHLYTQLSRAESMDATEALLPGNIKPPIMG